jgi:hypothetical protein
MKEIPKPQAKGAGSQRAPSAESDWNRLVPWFLFAGAAFLLLVSTAGVVLYFAFRVPQPASADEMLVLKTLEKNYDAKHQLDEKSRVVRLELEGPHVDDEALDEVIKLKYLKELSLATSSISDAGIQRLRELKRLDHLGITGTLVTDRGLHHLQKMPSLRHLWVNENERLTTQGIATLKKALPGLAVHVMGKSK